jgi:hypothetical protein
LHTCTCTSFDLSNKIYAFLLGQYKISLTKSLQWEKTFWMFK